MTTSGPENLISVYIRQFKIGEYTISKTYYVSILEMVTVASVTRTSRTLRAQIHARDALAFAGRSRGALQGSV